MTKIKTSTSFILALFLALVTPFWLGSCQEKPKTTDPEEVAEEQNKPADDATKEKDEEFLMKASELNLEEIQLGTLAQSKATHADVKALGKMMVDGHTKAQADLSALAGRKSIAIPTSPTIDVQDAVQKLGEKTGEDFDKEFCDMMVNGHEKAINLFENAAKNNGDPDINAWANAMLPDLRSHLDHAKTCRDKVKGDGM